MPTRPQRPCRHAGCSALTNDGYCDKHTKREAERHRQRAHDRTRQSASKRGYDRTWRRLRLLVLAKQPVCQACGRAPSTDVDHIVPLARGGINALDNLQGLCHSCHSAKTAREDGGFGV